MKGRLALLLPYIVGVLVLGTITWGNLRRDLTEAAPPTGAVAEMPAHVNENRPRLAAHLDAVCRMEVGENIATRYRDRTWYFCCEYCRETFVADPEKYLAETCLVCRADGEFTPVAAGQSPETTWLDHTYRFCTGAHRAAFQADPAGYFMHTMWGIPGWMYYASIAVILVMSFLLFEVRAWLGERGRTLPAPPPSSPRHDLLQHAGLAKALTSSGFRFVIRFVLVVLFLLIIAAGLFGNQLPSKNVAPLLTWTIWWGGLIWLVAYAGKIWCYACPWDAISDWAEGMRFWGKKKSGLSLSLPWPRWMRNIWPATLLFIALTWIELGFGVTMKPRMTAWLGLMILGLTFVSIFIFDRKSFCRYGCFVGRISGLYALFAPVELRARDAQVCADCETLSCYKGNDQGEGCPTFEFPARMDQNTYCTLCMECLSTCEQQNIALNLRPWGVDLVGRLRPRSDEAYLSLIILTLTAFHGLTMTGAWSEVVDWISSRLGVGEIVAFSLGMTAMMVAPSVVYALLVALSRLLAGAREVSYRDYFIRYAYALLPIALFYHLAHNSEHLLMEGQKVIALLSDPFGREWNLLGTADLTLQPLINLPTLWILQVLFVTIGHVFSLWAARHAAGALFPGSRAAFRSQVPMLVAMILFSVMSLWLLKQPMEMRTSAM